MTTPGTAGTSLTKIEDCIEDLISSRVREQRTAALFPTFYPKNIRHLCLEIKLFRKQTPENWEKFYLQDLGPAD